MGFRVRALLFACGLIGGHAAFAGESPPTGDIIRLDASRSDVGFRVKVMWLLGIRGHFGKVDGTVRLDPFRNELRVDARIDAASVRMASASYEEWVKSPEFFDAAAHPQIEFTSDAFPRARLRAGGELPGQLTVRGVRQPVQFDLKPAACDRPAYDCPIRVAGAIRRSMFGMGSHRGTLADKVELDFTVYALPPPRDAAPAPAPG
ncbi:MAG: YceI family protein [Dokdonella sp.]|uniref:YceI family protein n=1 Tax=Dokdonella sp. TaxID=2291710 RepID=UPI003F823019